MGKSWTRKRWVKAAVLTVGVADCVGIYYASHRLDNTVPDEVRYDRTAYTVPESSNMFHAGNTEMFADAGNNSVTHGGPALASASPAAQAPKAVELAAAPATPLRAPVLVSAPAVAAKPAAPAHLALAAPAKAAPAPVVKAKAAAPAHLALAAPAAHPAQAAPAPVAKAKTAAPARLALAAPAPAPAPAKVAPAPVAKAPAAKPAPVARLAAAAPKPAPAPAKAARQAEGPHSASVSHMLAALQPAPKAAARPAPAKAAAAPVVTPHLAAVAQPEKTFHASPAKLTGAKHTASLALGTDMPTSRVSTVSRKSRSHGATSLARLVPAPRETSEFAAAFAGMDSPISAQPLEATLPATTLAAPVLSADSTPVVSDTGLATAKGPVLENVLPAPQPELPAVSASAEDPAAKL